MQWQNKQDKLFINEIDKLAIGQLSGRLCSTVRSQLGMPFQRQRLCVVKEQDRQQHQQKTFRTGHRLLFSRSLSLSPALVAIFQ